MVPRKFLICALVLLGACEGREGSGTQQSAAEVQAQFVADPQPVAEQEIVTLEPGMKAPDFNLPGVDGKFYSLGDFSEAEALVILFTCNHCPTAQAYEQRIIDLTDDYKDKGVAVVAISPNSPIGLLFDELGYSDLGDTYKEMIIRAEDMNFNFPYLYDGDNHSVSMKYGPVATPHAFLFGPERTLRYTGRLDGSEKPGTARADDLRAAIDDVLAGREIEEPKTKTFGCSIKWAWKDDLKERVYGEWESSEVTLEDIDESGIAQLLENDSDNLRLVNVWATWCGPCIIEYPEFVEMQRMYGARNFEFISVSADKSEARESAHSFLKKKHSALTNYIFSGDDSYALIEAIDPEWDGALPYTMLIEPGGTIIYRTQGTINPLEMRKMIVEHPLMGRYY